MSGSKEWQNSKLPLLLKPTQLWEAAFCRESQTAGEQSQRSSEGKPVFHSAPMQRLIHKRKPRWRKNTKNPSSECAKRAFGIHQSTHSQCTRGNDPVFTVNRTKQNVNRKKNNEGQLNSRTPKWRNFIHFSVRRLRDSVGAFSFLNCSQWTRCVDGHSSWLTQYYAELVWWSGVGCSIISFCSSSLTSSLCS